MDERWQEIERIYHAARELDGSERAAFLTKACAGDAVLRSQVELLLAQAERAADFLETPAIEVAAEVIAKERQWPHSPKATLEIERMVAHYELAGKIGEGGMGKVYRARDTKLHRDVALKVLPEAMARDAQRMARFEREARMLASLNHPNIAAIYGFEESNGVRALVMELVEGETLEAKIDGEGSALPREPKGLHCQDALPIARQIAEALEYAHERGVIHRDLKPANIKITSEGAVKVLDFGLAKVLTPSDPSATGDTAESPGLTTIATMPGTLLGTAAYMSPEQAKGYRVDRRCDVWAFGCVLYEMLSGQKAFQGETISDVLAAVITKEPDWALLPKSTPLPIQRLIYRCLQKDLRQRLQAIGDARITIEEFLTGDVPAGLAGGAATSQPQISGGEQRLKRVIPWALAGLLAAALIKGHAIWKSPAPASAPFPVLAYIPPPPETTFRDSGFGAGPAVVSPDGNDLAFSATDQKGVTQLWVRPLRSTTAQVIAGTEDAAMPFWSADSHSLGFFADQKLKTVNVDNGNVEVLADASCVGAGGAWNAAGTILFTPRCDGPINQISSSGGKPSPAVRLEKGETTYRAPAFLSDGRRFLYMSSSSVNALPSIWMGSLDSKEQKQVLRGAQSPQFASGHLFFIRNGRIFAQPFDGSTGQVTGEATALAEARSYSISRRVLAFQGGTIEGRLEWFDRDGNVLGSIGPVAVYGSDKISPDGKHILAEVDDPQSNASDLWSYSSLGGVGTRLTFGPGLKTFALWSPDGKYVAHACQPDGKAGICRESADGSSAEQTLFTFGKEVFRVNVVDWSPDGRYISFDKFPVNGGSTEDWVLPLSGDRKPFRAAPVSASQYDGHFSPDGRWLAYFSYETGRPEVYVVPFPGPGGKFQISQNGGWLVRWDKEGHLYFLTMGNRLMEADLKTIGGAVTVKALHPIFQLNLPSFAAPFFDVARDGSRFLVITSADPSASESIAVLLDWQSKLEGKE